MGTKSIRLGSTLNFDEFKERDIVEFIEQLNSSHKTGQFLANVIRLAFDNPELVKRGATAEQSDMLIQLERMGMSEERRKFIASINSEITEMKNKVDSIYDMATKMYMLSLTGNRLGLDKKADNMLMANFVLERQIKEINDTLGVNPANAIFESKRLDTEHTKAEEYMEFIINSYAGIINELQNMTRAVVVQSEVTERSQECVEVDTPKSTAEVKEQPKTTVTETKAEEVVVEDKSSNAETVPNDDIVDFGMDGGFADMSTFFGVG